MTNNIEYKTGQEENFNYYQSSHSITNVIPIPNDSTAFYHYLIKH